MTLSMRRIVLFARNMLGMGAFYRDVLGLRLRRDEKGWKELDAATGLVVEKRTAIRLAFTFDHQFAAV